MTFCSWVVDGARPIVATAIHAGHELRPEVVASMTLEPGDRRREEDPHTDELAAVVGSHVIVHRSRFEVDLNRDRSSAVYVEPEDAWGLDLWAPALERPVIERSRALHDAFYRRLGDTLDSLVRDHGGFVLYDVHSYNHRRHGPDSRPADPRTDPVVNLGTGSMPAKWRPVAEAFLDAMTLIDAGGVAIDARENVKFRGRYMAEFVHDRYGQVGCALAVEFKKTFMNEWTGEVFPGLFDDMKRSLAATVEPVREAHHRCR
ncbi:N-formylglutamate amidohydrolase [soil metagenome]